VIESYYNAINRHEFLRAYSYWEPNAAAENLLPYEEFARGYAGTQSVSVTLGSITGDVGAGQLYYYVPVVLEATTTDGGSQTFAGCYGLHIGRPDVQAAPPYHPLAIEKASIDEVAAGGDDAGLLTRACADEAGQATPGSLTSDGLEYRDDRGSPEAVLASLYNAISRHEYARAYSYWEAGAEGLPPFDAFADGYARTESVTLTSGKAQTGAAAGNLYFSVPVALVARLTDGSTQTFAGCYVLHLSQPANQATPPFRPLAIQSGALEQVANDADIGDLLAGGCQE
jgi:hypothetical protein